MAMNDGHADNTHNESVADMSENYQERVPEIQLDINSTTPYAFASAFSNLYRISAPQYGVVAVKALRMIGDLSQQEPRDRLKKLVMREMRTWHQLRHKNVLPLMGFCQVTREYFVGLVSEWKPEGHILNYTSSYPDTDKLSLLMGCAEGLSYLHSRKVVHGDLKCQNVLISSSEEGEPVPLICDFGASRIMGVSGYTTQAIWGTQGFLAPELIDDSNGANVIPTLQSDVWAFGVMAYQLYMGHEQISSRMKFSTSMRRPSDVLDLTSPVWTLMSSCWHRQDPAKRPRAEDIRKCLDTIQMTGKLPDNGCIMM